MDLLYYPIWYPMLFSQDGFWGSKLYSEYEMLVDILHRRLKIVARCRHYDIGKRVHVNKNQYPTLIVCVTWWTQKLE